MFHIEDLMSFADDTFTSTWNKCIPDLIQIMKKSLEAITKCKKIRISIQ
jgi:hypothetical protein